MTPDPPLDAVYNRDCGQVLAGHADRAIFEPFIAAMAAAGCWSLRTRRGTDDDIAALLQKIKCERCDALPAAQARLVALGCTGTLGEDPGPDQAGIMHLGAEPLVHHGPCPVHAAGGDA